MALDFPLSANPGDTYSSDKKTWEWSGEAWDSIDVLVDNSVSTTRWDSTYTTVTGNSATWSSGGYDDSALQAASGDWNASYSIAQGITGLNNYVENTPNVHHTALIGGEGLSATGFGQDSFLGGGTLNRVESYASGIIGGEDNVTSGDNSFLAGGNYNVCDGYGSTIIGSNGANVGNVNNSAMISTAGGTISGSANESIIIGGENNIIHQTGYIAAIVGGDRCEINKPYGIASGRKAIVNHNRARVFADGNDTVFTSISADEFAIQASGLRLDDGNQAAGRVLTCDLSGTGTWQDIPAGGYDDSALQAASGSWDSTYTTVSANSATWAAPFWYITKMGNEADDASGTGEKTAWVAPAAGKIYAVHSGCSVATAGAALTVDVQKNAVTVLSTKGVIASGDDSTTTGTVHVLSATPTSFAAGDRISFHIDTFGGTGANGLHTDLLVSWD